MPTGNLSVANIQAFFTGGTYRTFPWNTFLMTAPDGSYLTSYLVSRCARRSMSAGVASSLAEAVGPFGTTLQEFDHNQIRTQLSFQRFVKTTRLPLGAAMTVSGRMHSTWIFHSGELYGTGASTTRLENGERIMPRSSLSKTAIILTVPARADPIPVRLWCCSAPGIVQSNASTAAICARSDAALAIPARCGCSTGSS